MISGCIFCVKTTCGKTCISRIGGNPSQLHSFFDFYKAKLEPVNGSVAHVVTRSIDEALGKSESFSGYLSHFTREIEARGVENNLKANLPVLMPGVAASAFHAVIRLAYAVESHNLGELERNPGTGGCG